MSYLTRREHGEDEEQRRVDASYLQVYDTNRAAKSRRRRHSSRASSRGAKARPMRWTRP